MKINKKTGLRMFDIETVRSWGPCYEPERYLKAGVRYSAVALLQDERIPFADRLWVVLRSDLASEKLMRLFAVWCARQVQHLMKDPRSINALNVAERFAHGQAARDELNAASAAAWEAARGAASAAAEDAARYAARYAAWDAARDAAEDAARYAAWDAARDAAWDAASVAAWEAARYAAWEAAWAAAGAAARAAASAAQCNKLIEMFLAEGQERLKRKRK